MSSIEPEKNLNQKIVDKIKELLPVDKMFQKSRIGVDYTKLQSQRTKLMEEIKVLVDEEVKKIKENFATSGPADLLEFNKDKTKLAFCTKSNFFFSELDKHDSLPVQFVSFVGDARSGKSSNANFLVAGNSVGGFDVASGDADTCTHGVKIWAKILQDKHMKKRIVILLDSEGLSRENSGEGDQKQTKFLILMSDLVVFQTKKSLRETGSLDSLLEFMKAAEEIKKPENSHGILVLPPITIVTSTFMNEQAYHEKKDITEFFKQMSVNDNFGQDLAKKGLWNTFQTLIKDKLIFRKIKYGDGISEAIEGAKERGEKTFYDYDFDLEAAISNRENRSFLENKLLETPVEHLRPIQREKSAKNDETDKGSNFKGVEGFFKLVVDAVNWDLDTQKIVDKMIDDTISDHTRALLRLVNYYEGKETAKPKTDLYWNNYSKQTLRDKLLAYTLKFGDQMFKKFNFGQAERYAYERLEKAMSEGLEISFKNIENKIAETKANESKLSLEEFAANLKKLSTDIANKWNTVDAKDDDFEGLKGLTATSQFAEIICKKCEIYSVKCRDVLHKNDPKSELNAQKFIKKAMFEAMNDIIAKFEAHLKKNKCLFLEDNAKAQKEFLEKQKEKPISAEILEKVKNSILEELKPGAISQMKFMNEKQLIDSISDKLEKHHESKSQIILRQYALEMFERVKEAYEAYCDSLNAPLLHKIEEFNKFYFSTAEIAENDVPLMVKTISTKYKELSKHLKENWVGSQSKLGDAAWLLTKVYAKKSFMIEPQRPIYERFDGVLGALTAALIVGGFAALAVGAAPVAAGILGTIGSVGGWVAGFGNMVAKPAEEAFNYLVETAVEEKEYLSALKTYHFNNKEDSIPVLQFDENSLKWYWTC